jgi:signal transduction histidine kinase
MPPDTSRLAPPAQSPTPQSPLAGESDDHAERDYLTIAITDQGHGISSEHLTDIFEPFYTTKDVGEGTGLGLSIAYGIIHDHGGWIDVVSTPGQGSCFTIYLPQEAA